MFIFVTFLLITSYLLYIKYEWLFCAYNKHQLNYNIGSANAKSSVGPDYSTLLELQELQEELVDEISITEEERKGYFRKWIEIEAVITAAMENNEQVDLCKHVCDILYGTKKAEEEVQE